jgi:hypothetical protein
VVLAFRLARSAEYVRGGSMLPSPATRPVLTRFRIGLVLLCAAIFLWGLHAKLSLYKPPSPSRSASVAKLIQGKQSSHVVGTVDHRVPKHLLRSLVLFSISAVIVIPPMLADRRNHHAGDPRRYSNLQYSSPLIIRPPPSIL